MLVTLHLAEGQTAKQLIGEVTRLAGGARPRSVSGRFGVLVDAELAYRYLAARYVPPPAPMPVRELASPPPTPAVPVSAPAVPVSAPAVPVSAPAVPVSAPAVPVSAPAKKVTAKKTPPKATTAKGE